MNSEHLEFFKLFQKTYLTNCIYRFPLDLEFRKGSVYLIKVQRPFDKSWSICVLVILFSIIFCISWAILIVRGEGVGNQYWMDIRILLWFGMLVIAICEGVVYHETVVKNRDLVIYSCKEMVDYERKLKQGTYTNIGASHSEMPQWYYIIHIIWDSQII